MGWFGSGKGGPPRPPSLGALLEQAESSLNQLRVRMTPDFPLLNAATREVQAVEQAVMGLPPDDASRPAWCRCACPVSGLLLPGVGLLGCPGLTWRGYLSLLLPQPAGRAKARASERDRPPALHGPARGRGGASGPSRCRTCRRAGAAASGCAGPACSGGGRPF